MDKNSYALGMSVAHNMRSSGVKDLRAEDFAAGLKAVLEGGPTELSWEEASQVLDRYFTALEAEKQAQQAEVADAMKAQGKAFLEQNAKAEGVTTLPSGLQYKVLKPGSGRKPGPSDRVRCHYEGTFIDGQVFDSSYRRGEPAVFGVNQVIKGWTQALQLMAEGAEWMLYIPYPLAYGEAGAHGSIPPCATLIFKVALLEVL